MTKFSAHKLARVGLASALMALAVLPIGCKKKSTTDIATAAGSASAAPSGSAQANVKAGPCGEYATKVCESAGKESQTCQAVNTTTDIMPDKVCSAALKDVKYSLDKIAEKRKSCDQLVEKLCSEVGKETESCKMVQDQTKKFPPDRCEQMLSHVPEIVADLKKREEKNKPMTPEAQASLAVGNAPSFGPASAPVTIVEFSDFQCPYCSKAAAVTKQIKEKYGSKVKFIFRQFPLSFHKDARLAAEASLAAHAQGKFWEYHDMLFDNQQKLDAASLEDYAKKVGLNVATFKAALEKHEHGPAIDSDMKLGEQVAVEGTPTLFINGARVGNPSDFAAISQQIDALLANSPG